MKWGHPFAKDHPILLHRGNGLEYNRSEDTSRQPEVGNGSEDQKKRIEDPASRPRRKSKFQADLAPAEDRSVRLLKEELQLSSNTDFLSDAVALFRWAVSERKLGALESVSESASGEQKRAALSAAGTRGSPDLVPAATRVGYQMVWARTGKSC